MKYLQNCCLLEEFEWPHGLCGKFCATTNAVCGSRPEYNDAGQDAPVSLVPEWQCTPAIPHHLQVS